MTKEDLQTYCKDNGIPCGAVGPFRVMDLTQLPEHMRENFDERGVFKAPAEVLEDAPKSEVKGDELVSDDLPGDLADLTVVELKDQARDLEISGFSSMTKDELVKAIKKANK